MKHASSPSLCRLAWLNAFPLAMAFTPLMAGAAEQHFLPSLAEQVSSHMHVYTLAADAPTYVGQEGNKTSSMASGIAVGAVGGVLQQWLSHFGIAHGQVDAAQNITQKNSHFDRLMPLYNQENNLTFTQGRLHHTDGQAQVSPAARLRHFTRTYMPDCNLFGD